MAVKEYIEREAAVCAIERRIKQLMKDPEFRRKRADVDLYGAKKIMMDIPAADVRPVAHGKWVPSDMQEGWITCSVCKKLKLDGRMALSPDLFKKWGLNFCPNCGADMRQEKEEGK